MIRKMCMGTMGAAAILFLAAGCDSQKTQPNPVIKTEPEHHHHGPNEGEVIELEGDGHFHAELLQDLDAKTVAVFLLGEDEITPATTAADKLVIRITLTVNPRTWQPRRLRKMARRPAMFPKFESKDGALRAALAHETADRELEVKIGDKPYKGKFTYYEPHDHGHAHDDEHKDEHKDEEKGKDAKP